MKNRKKRSLSVRCAILFILFAGLSILQLILLVVFALGTQKILYIPFLLIPLQMGLFYSFYKYLYQPYSELTRILKLFNNGYIHEEIFHVSCPFSNEMEETIQKFGTLIDTQELISVSKKQSEYLALQNQINPHFLYNTLEGIRGEALSAGVTSIAEMTEALATFFRYTISNVENLVTLEDELTNIENYYIIQQYRFGERLSMSIVIDSKEERSKILSCRLPKLTLQPIIENSINHGLERKLGKGSLKVKIEMTQKRLIITISDDGLGFDEGRLKELNSELNSRSMQNVKLNTEKKGGIALINVNSRIKLLFGEEYGIYIYSTPNVGTDVEITLPVIRDDTVDRLL